MSACGDTDFQAEQQTHQSWGCMPCDGEMNKSSTLLTSERDYIPCNPSTPATHTL